MLHENLTNAEKSQELLLSVAMAAGLILSLIYAKSVVAGDSSVLDA